MDKIRAAGAIASPYDIRTFTYPVKGFPIQSGGQRYKKEDIEDQSKVGICTSISLTQNARKATGIAFSADFQYLLQKKYHDANTPFGWDEGSSIFAAVSIGKNYGFLPASEWKWTTQSDRDLPYHKYIEKLKAVPEEEIQRLLKISAKYKLKAYAYVPVNRDAMAEAIHNSKAGILVRFSLGNEWFTAPNGQTSWNKKDIEPLRPPKKVITGHAVTESNYDGGSFRIANSWGWEWCDLGTAYHSFGAYKPTEAWAVWYQEEELPKEIVAQKEERQQPKGQALDFIQKIIALILRWR